MARSLDTLVAPADQARVVDAIRRAEARTSGEVKVHVEARCPGGDPFARARALFAHLGLEKTRERNGVLIYVAVDDRRFAILGDAGIHDAVGGQPFWEGAATKMRAAFVRGALADGLLAAIDEVGTQLAERFPHRADDVNELSDDISTDDD